MEESSKHSSTAWMFGVLCHFTGRSRSGFPPRDFQWRTLPPEGTTISALLLRPAGSASWASILSWDLVTGNPGKWLSYRHL